MSDDGRMIYFSEGNGGGSCGGDVRVRSSSDEDQEQKMEEISSSRMRLSYSRIISLSSPGRR